MNTSFSCAAASSLSNFVALIRRTLFVTLSGFIPLYASFVLTPSSGLIITIRTPFRSKSIGVKISPIPSAKQGTLYTKNAQSAPKTATSFANSSLLSPNPNNSFNAIAIWAASLLPPPSPAPKGMFFLKRIATFPICGYLVCIFR